MGFQSYFSDFLNLVFPQLCIACTENAPMANEILCLKCRATISESKDYLIKENYFTQHFYGRVEIYTGSSLFYYNKGGIVQKAIQNLKYKNNKKVGIIWGQEFGAKLIKAKNYNEIDLIIPVPLHPKKERLRGYNQSDLFAEGLSKSMQRPWLKNVLIRHRFTETQTNKSRVERIDNVQSAFGINRDKELENKHVLLVDDVLTTGATLESCAIEILKVSGTKVSCVTMAMGGLF